MDIDIRRANVGFLEAQTASILDWGRRTFGDRLFTTSAFGINGTVLLRIAREVIPDLPVYFIDTGYHFDETLELCEHYKQQGFDIHIIAADAAQAESDCEQVGHDACCRVNKVEPIRKLLAEKKGHLWITGLSRDQAPTRRNIPFVQKLQTGVYKLSPLVAWRQEDIWYYVRQKDLKYNRLYDKGYKSIGCRPCTTPVASDEEPRAGRWRGTDRNECGLHTDFPGSID
ncbi:MAG: phosphoadenylyl-sulfate reductase [Anaerolineaceae bacterium]|nr:phosphoadenylyl-sulfate reductase [Anaerolineaceae bacterium]